MKTVTTTNIALTLTCFLVSGSIHAVLLSEWDGVSGTNIAGVPAQPEISSANMTRASGISAAGGGTFNSSGFLGSTSFATALSNSDYIIFGITVQPGFQVSNLSISVDTTRNTQGPQTAGFGIDTSGGSSFVQIGSNFSVPTSATVISSSTTGTNLTGTITLAIMGWSAGNAAGRLDITNGIGGGSGNVGLQVFGDITAVPEPGVYALLAGGLVLGFVARKRRRS